jgi:hypothetical protein
MSRKKYATIQKIQGAKREIFERAFDQTKNILAPR